MVDYSVASKESGSVSHIAPWKSERTGAIWKRIVDLCQETIAIVNFILDKRFVSYLK